MKLNDSRKSKGMTWSKKKDKFIICKDGTYFALTYAQVFILSGLLDEIINSK